MKKLTFFASTSIRLTISPDSQSQNITKPLPLTPSNVPQCKLSIDQLPEPFIPVPGRSLKFLNILSLTLLSKTAYVLESGAQANEISFPKLLFRQAREV